MSSKYTLIGKLHKPAGTHGEMKLFVEDIFLDDLLNSDHFFIKINGSFVPYFIEDIRETNHLLIKIEEIEDPETALGLVNKEVYLLKKSIRSETFGSINKKQEYEGFTIWDNGVKIGMIEEIELMPQQVIAWVNFNQKRVAIPLAEGLIDEVDIENKKIAMNLPEGILYL